MNIFMYKWKHCLQIESVYDILTAVQYVRKRVM